MDKKILPADKSAVKFAVIRIGGKQYKVTEGQEILVDKMTDLKALPEVLLIADGEKVEIGTPVLTKAKVTFKVLAEVEKGEKVRVFKYKAKARQRKLKGFRAQYSRLLVESISK